MNPMLCGSKIDEHFLFLGILVPDHASHFMQDIDRLIYNRPIEKCLQLAVINDHKDAVELLLKHGADLDTKTSDGEEDVLSFATTKMSKTSSVADYLEVLKILITRSAMFKNRTKQQKSMLFKDVFRGGTLEAIHLLIENGIKLEESGVEFPLHEAALNPRSDILEFLLKSCLFIIDALDDEGATPLLRAVMSKNVAYVKLLIEWGANVEKRMTLREDGSLLSPVAAAVLSRNPVILDLLLAVGARLNPNNDEEDKSLFYFDLRHPNPINYCLIAQLILLASCKELIKTDPRYMNLRKKFSSEFVDKCLAELEILKSHIL
ncbi:hypothetical protein QAD02_018663 [Eretmocerus hayati]|uniref:Uncharacterized protein n=1 Tax=Eretmocerus hayati TaxID=131215 RepID=A0ACC2PJ58_9HYME|nr:hypothetical protein QAD02_018663 [Eretmocerus hayati]